MAVPAALCPPPVPHDSIKTSKQFHLQTRSLFFADKKTYKDGCGDYEETENGRLIFDLTEHGYEREYVRKNCAVKIGRDLQHGRKCDEEKREDEQGICCGEQAGQASEGNGDAFAAAKSVKQRKNVSDYRCGDYKGRDERMGAASGSIMHIQKYREKSL